MTDPDRWQLALDGIKDLSQQYLTLVRSMQSGFSTLSLENAALRQRLAQIEAEQYQLRREMHTMDMTLQQLLPHMAAIAAYVVAQRPPPVSRPPRRAVNGE